MTTRKTKNSQSQINEFKDLSLIVPETTTPSVEPKKIKRSSQPKVIISELPKTAVINHIPCHACQAMLRLIGEIDKKTVYTCVKCSSKLGR